MREEVVIICPELSAGRGGVADYTLRVVEQWEGILPVRFIVPRSIKREPPPSATEVERSTRALRRKLPASGGRVLLQYSAYGFDRFGYPRWLLRGLRDWKRKSGGRLVIMFHEIWTFWPMWNKNYFVQQLHRCDLRMLIAKADAVFTSTASQAAHLHALCPASAVEILPVGSNIRPLVAREGAREEGMAVLFGLQDSRLHALRKMQADLESLASRRVIRKLVSVGGGGTAEDDRAERELLGKLQLAEGYEHRGVSAEEEISALLFSARFGISVQDELSVTKSGTFMAFAAHGLNILSRFASLSQQPPLCWATSPSELRQGIPEEELRVRGGKLRAWQERTCSWPHIAARFADALQTTRQ